MRHLLPFLIILICSFSFGQNNLLNTAISWFSRTDRTAIETYLKNYNYQFMTEKDSVDLQLMSYSLVKTENGTQPFIHILLGDTALEFISVDTYGAQGQQLIVSGLKSGRFKSIGTDINGNFITTTYDNGTFLIQEDYEAVGNPLGKGEIAYFRYRIFRKYGKFDTMNGEKIQLAQEGTKIAANYKNGILDGQRTTYFPDGTIKRTENYRAGRLNGTASDYNQQGKLIHSSTHSYHWKYGMEKWYNNEGKIVKSLQWQRDIPTGIEKQTFNGTVIGSVSYIKGAKQGLAKVPVYYDATIEAAYPLDTLNDEPLAIETVTYINGLKSGKAVCTYFHTADTMYVGYYNAGKRDSVFSRHGKDGILYTTFFSDGLENGSRIFRIPFGPLKDSIYRVENYKEGKLHGLTTQYYQKESGQWKKIHQEENYSDGIRNGTFVYQDLTNNNTEFYLDGKLHGRQEYEVISGGKKTTIRKSYENGLRTGEWTTENMTDAVLVTENYKNDKKQGSETKTIKGKLVEKRFFHDGVLIHIKSLYENGDYRSFDSDESESQDSVTIAYAKKSGDTTWLKCYSFSRTDFPRKDTMLLLLAAKIQASPTEDIASSGLSQLTTPTFHTAILLKNGKMDGQQIIMHGKTGTGTGIMEKMIYHNGTLVSAEYREYQNTKDMRPYSGVFFSDYSHEKIAVKAGLRHGWSVEHTVSGKEIRRMKYKKGVLIKMIEYRSN
jgi:antitoxin component YwqK of YwqJK toxin-antitoxin module